MEEQAHSPRKRGSLHPGVEESLALMGASCAYHPFQKASQDVNFRYGVYNSGSM
jgi:hypothetical protein